MSEKVDKKATIKASKKKRHTKVLDEEVSTDRSSVEVPASEKSYPTAVPKLSEEEEVSSVTEVELHEEDVFPKISAASLVSFGELQDQNQTIDITFSKPELVFIGKSNVGKTTLIESLLRKARLLTTSSIRPMTIHVNFRESSDFTLRKDYSLKEYDEDMKISSSDVEEMLNQRNQETEMYDPISLDCSTTESYPITYLDNPGNESESYIEKVISPSNRIIILVIDCSNISESEDYIQLVKKIDPTGGRTFFIYTHFFEVAKGFQNSRDAAKFFNSVEKNSYFLSLPSTSLRFTDKESATEIHLRLARRDKDVLNAIQADAKFIYRLGLPSFEQVLIQRSWKHYQAQLPVGLQSFRKGIAAAKQRCETIKLRAAKLTKENLRALATEHAAGYLRLMTEIIKGTCEGDAEFNGQTLEDEQERAGSSLSDNVDLETMKENVSTADKKLYGGQQFIRLLDEFKVASTNCPSIDTYSLEDLESDTVQNIPRKIWMTADLVRSHVQDVFLPLIERLVLRAAYIFGRTPSIAAAIINAKTDAAGKMALASEFPSFRDTIDECYAEFVESVKNNTLAKCRDEFFSTKTLCWNLENSDITSSGEPADWAKALFTLVCQRIQRNIIGKMYNFFLTPFETELWKTVQCKVSCLSVDELSDLFMLEGNKKRCEEAIAAEQSKIDDLISQEKEYKTASGSFAYPK